MSVNRIVASNSRAPKLWQGIIGDPEFREQHKDIIECLFNGDYNPSDLERLHGHRVVRSIRQNIKSRFLLTTFTYNGRHYLLPLELLENHEYDKSRFLQPGVLEAWVENQLPMLLEQIRELEGRATSTEEEKPQSFKLTNFDFIGQKVIQFNPDQEEGLAVSLPAIIRGAPGSGKTLLLLKRAKEFLAQNSDPEIRVLFYTDHPYLIEDVKKLWDLPNETRIEFRSKNELVTEQDPTLKDATLVGDKEFSVWMDNHVKGYEGQCKARREKITQEMKKFLDDRKGQYLAFQQIAANLAFNQIEVDEKLKWEQIVEKGFNGGETLGQYDERQRKFFAEAFLSYDKSLKQMDRQTRKRKFDPKLQKFNLSKRYDLVLVDEYQDSSRLELAETWQLAKTPGNVCYAGDQLQNLNEQESQLQFLLNVMHKDKQSETIVMLPFTFRCPDVSVRVINAFIKFLYNVSGGKSDKHQQTSVKVAEQKSSSSAEQSKGNFVWLDDTNSEELKNFIAANEKSIYVVIVPENADKDELRKLYRGATLLTAREIKGREYDNVIVHDPFADDMKLVVEACKKFDPATAGQQTNLPKFGAGDNSYNQMVHQWIVDVSRNLKNCIFVQPVTHQTKKLKQFVLQEAGLLQAEAKIAQTVHIATTDEIETEVRGLLLTGNETEALQQWQAKLGRNQREFNKFKEEIFKRESKTATSSTVPASITTSTAPTPSVSTMATTEDTIPSTATTARSIPPNILVGNSETQSLTKNIVQQNKKVVQPTKKSTSQTNSASKNPTDLKKLQEMELDLFLQMTPQQMAMDLVKNFSQMKLAKLLTKNIAETVLFDVDIDKKGSKLFHYIIELHADDLFSILRDIRFGMHIARRIFNTKSGVNEVTHDNIFFWHVMQLIKFNQQEANHDRKQKIKSILIALLLEYKIDAIQLIKFILLKSSENSDPGKRFFHFMAAFTCGNEFLQCFFSLYSEQIKQIPLDTFTKDNYLLIKIMAFSQSSCLPLIFKQFPTLTNISSNDLFAYKKKKLTQEDAFGYPDMSAQSLFEALSSYHEGRIILIKILKANPSLKPIDAKDLITRRSAFNEFKGLVPLLMPTAEGQELLTLLGVQLDIYKLPLEKQGDASVNFDSTCASHADIEMQKNLDLTFITQASVPKEKSGFEAFSLRGQREKLHTYCEDVYNVCVRALVETDGKSNAFAKLVNIAKYGQTQPGKLKPDPCLALNNVFVFSPEFIFYFPFEVLFKHNDENKVSNLEKGFTRETYLGLISTTSTGLQLFATLMRFPNRFDRVELAKVLCLFHKSDQGKAYSPLLNVINSDVPRIAETLILYCRKELIAELSAGYIFKQKVLFFFAFNTGTHDLLLELFQEPNFMTKAACDLVNDDIKALLKRTDKGSLLIDLVTKKQEQVAMLREHSLFPPRTITPTSTSSSTPSPSPNLPMPTIAIPSLNLDTRPSLVRPAPSEPSQTSITTKI